MEKNRLSDLSFFRFPALTTDVVWDIVLLFAVLVVTVVLTVIAHHRMLAWSRARKNRETFDRFSSEHHMPESMREVFNWLVELAGVKSEYDLVSDGMLYEQAVAALMARDGEDGEATIRQLENIRQRLHLNVMNSELALVSTRQLLQDLPVRILVGSADERLDLYCTLFKKTEAFMVFDFPARKDVLRLLMRHPEALLAYWRSDVGETMFRITLEPVQAEGFTLFRASHVFRDEELAQRSTFRLTADLPLTFEYVEAGTVLSRRMGKKPPSATARGAGRLIDLGYGGASLELPRRLEEGGFAKIHFALSDRPMEVMFEVLSTSALGEGNFLVRGRFPAHTDEGSENLRRYLMREQTKRLRENELLLVRTGN